MSDKPSIFSEALQAASNTQEQQLLDYKDYDAVRQNIFDKIYNSVSSAFPIENERYKLTVDDLKYRGMDEYRSTMEKDAVLTGSDINKRLTGKYKLIDKTTGKTVDTSGNVTLMSIPYLTDRGEFVRRGVRYTVPRQFRVDPGVYTRIADNGMIETNVNIKSGTGHNFKIEFDPDKSTFYYKLGNRKIPLVYLMESMGIPSEKIKKVMGEGIYDLNAKIRPSPHAISWVSSQLQQDKEAAEDSTPNNSLYNYFAEMELDPVTTQRTLGAPHTNLDSDVFLKAVDKALKVYHKQADTDDRDSLAYQSVHDFADMISEKIGKDQNRVLRNQLWKLTRTGSLKSMPSGVLNKHLDHLFNVSGLAQALEEVSPLDAVAQNERVVKLGEGGIPTVQQAPMDARAVQPSYLGYIDAVAGPESLRVGLDMFMAHNVRRGKNDNLLYTQFINPKSGKREWVSTKQAVDSTIAFPEYLKTNEDYVPAVIKGDKMGYAHRKDVDYIVPSGDELYSSMVNFIPLKSGIKGMRTLMGAKYPKQAMPLVENEVPLVDTKVSQSDGSEISMSKLLGKYNGAKFAPTSGTVKAVYKDHLVLQGDDGKKHRIDLYNNLPLARKTVLDNTASVKAGDKVNKGDLLAISNFTDKEGRAAPGKNLDVAYMNYKGSTFEDAVVISEKAADKLKHIALYPVNMDKEPELIYDKHRYRTLFPSKFDSKQMAKLDDRGIVKPGSIVEYGDPLITGVRKKVPELSSLGRRIQLDETETWDHHTRGVVTDVAETDKGYKVFVRAEEPMKEADKLALRVGGKGVVARIIKNADMPKNENGDPIDVVISRLTIPSRTNSAQMIEAVLGKVASKTGKRYELPGFLDQPLHKFAEEEAKKHNVKINEDLYDPETGKKIPGVFVGKLYAMKTQQTSESKGKARSTDFYGLEGEPGRGGKHGSKHMGCFVPHQKIDTLYGPQRISNLVEKKHSEYVWTYDKGKDEWEYKPITNWFKYRASVDDIISIDVSGTTLSCTKNHKIYLYNGDMKLAGELKEGDELIARKTVSTDTDSKLSKVPARIKKIRPYKHPKKGVKEINVYDFTVADTHCYSTGSILVSNSMELEALIGHQAPKVLKDTKLIRGQKNDEFWRDVKAGRTPTIPDTPLAYEKFKNLVRAAGVNYDEGTVSDSIFAMTNQQAKNLTGNRKLQNARTFAKDTLKPLPNGLFDPSNTGSTSKGEKWAFYETPEPMLNPIMENSVRRLLDITSKEFDRIVSGEEEYKGDRGGYALRKMLQDIDLDTEERKAKEIISNGPKSKLDKAIKKYRVIKSLKNKDVRPEDFMMTRIPVLPPKHRPIKKMQDITLVADLNHLYKELYNAMEDYKDVKGADVPEDVKQNARHTMYRAYKDLTGITKPVKAKLQEGNVGGIISQLFGKDSAKSCYDDDTELLTEDGWMDFKKYEGQCKVATVHPLTHNFEYHDPTHIIHDTYTGDMVHLNFRNKIDLLVTPTHRNWVHLRDHKGKHDLSSNWNFMHAEDMVQCGTRMHMLRTAEGFRGSTQVPEWVQSTPEEFAEFVGLWTAEGSIHSDRHAVDISQIPTEKNKIICKRLDYLIEQIGLSYSRYEFELGERTDEYKGNASYSVRWSILDKRLVKWLCTHVKEGALNKHFSREIHNWDASLLRSLVCGFLQGDGFRRQKRCKEGAISRHRYTNDFYEWSGFSTISKKLVDDFIEIGCKIGVSFYLHEIREFPDKPNRHKQYQVYLATCHYATASTKGKYIKRIPYTGGIHCVTVPNGLLIVRRNGKTCVSGNSLIKRKVLETNVDVAGMGVVAPNPALKLNQVGLPVNQAWDLYEPFIIQYMVRNNVPATTAAREVETRSKRAFDALQKVVSKRPVILNRAPSLHKYSMMALWPRLVRGDVVQVPPQIVEPMGMDFDGDEQINTVLIALPKENKGCLSKNLFGNSEDWNYTKTWKKQKENSMAYVNFGVAGEKSYDFYVIDLEEFPHMEKVSSKEHRTFYRVPEGVKVIAFDEVVNKPVLTDVALWSEHKDREVWLVNLSNKKQIITDDDERAVYGILKGTYDFVRRRPVEAMDVLVPQMRNTDSIYNETFLTLPTKKYYTESNATTNHIHSGITLDSDFGYLLGAVAGDGWVTYNKDKVAGQVNISGTEKEVVDKVKKSVSKLFPEYTPKWHFRQIIDSMGKSTTHVFTSIETAKMLTDLIGRGAHNKHLPPFWHRTKREFRIGLLSGLLDTDGSICVTHGKKKPQLACNIGSVSLRLLREAQQLLFSLGIYSKILFSTKTKSNNDFWMLSISAVDIYKVKNELVCEKQRIHRSLEECKPEGTSKQAVKNDMIPIDKETADALYKRLRVLNKEGKVKSGLYSALNRSKKIGRVARTTFNKAVDLCPDIEIPVQLKKIAENTEITWTYVKDIENTGKKETGYDLTVPGYETFMSMDGVILSNTASYTVPVSDQAVQEAIDKMMPDKHLISGRRNEPNFIPSQEYAEGLYYASKEPRRQQPVRFASEQAMKEAYKRGEIQVDTPVVIG